MHRWFTIAVLPGGAFDVGRTPADGGERRDPAAVGVLAAEEVRGGVVQVVPVCGALEEPVVICLIAKGFGDLRDAEVAVGRVDGFGGGLLDLIGRDVAEAVIELEADAAVAVAGITGAGGVLGRVDGIRIRTRMAS